MNTKKTVKNILLSALIIVLSFVLSAVRTVPGFGNCLGGRNHGSSSF